MNFYGFIKCNRCCKHSSVQTSNALIWRWEWNRFVFEQNTHKGSVVKIAQSPRPPQLLPRQNPDQSRSPYQQVNRIEARVLHWRQLCFTRVSGWPQFDLLSVDCTSRFLGNQKCFVLKRKHFQLKVAIPIWTKSIKGRKKYAIIRTSSYKERKQRQTKMLQIIIKHK